MLPFAIHFGTEKNKQKLLYGGRCNDELEILRKEIGRHEALPPISRIRELSSNTHPPAVTLILPAVMLILPAVTHILPAVTLILEGETVMFVTR